MERKEPSVAAPRRNDILVLGKVGAVLQAFADGIIRAGPSEIAARIGANKSTAFRLLSSMERVGLVDRYPDGTYGLGLRLMELGALVGERLDLRSRAEPVLAQLRDAVGQTVFLTVRHDEVATCIDRLPGSHVEVMALRLGGQLPLYCGAAPRVLLAGMEPAALDRYLSHAPFEQRTVHTLVTEEALRGDVARTRQQGYTVSMEDVTLGVAAAGAPIFDHRGSVVAAVSVAGLQPEYHEIRLPKLIDELRRAAARISAAIAGQDGWI